MHPYACIVLIQHKYLEKEPKALILFLCSYKSLICADVLADEHRRDRPQFEAEPPRQPVESLRAGVVPQHITEVHVNVPPSAPDQHERVAVAHRGG